jgi:hypothetical protein
MARIYSETFTIPADETPAYSAWGEVGSATSVDAAVTVTNNESPDLWLQWTDDPEGPEPEDHDPSFMPAADPNGQHYYVIANGLTPQGAYVRFKGIAYGTQAGPCHATLDD